MYGGARKMFRTSAATAPQINRELKSNKRKKDNETPPPSQLAFLIVVLNLLSPAIVYLKFISISEHTIHACICIEFEFYSIWFSGINAAMTKAHEISRIIM